MKQIATKVGKKENLQQKPVYQGKKERQIVFIDAYLANAFNISAACRNVGIDRGTYYRWLEDEEFVVKLDEAREAKKDFIESQLMKKVAAGDTIAIIFACKCLLADRGYVHHLRGNGRPISHCSGSA